MRNTSRVTRITLSIVTLAVIAMGTLGGKPADAGTAPAAAPSIGPVGGPTGGLLCGFTAIWTCRLPNGRRVRVIGTRCDINEFEQQTGATCRL